MTFVLGAAFSAEVELPLGSALKRQIVSAIHHRNGMGGDETLRGAIESARLQAAAWDLREALMLAMSIDNLVEHHAANDDFVRAAKLAIARVINQAEAASPIARGAPLRDDNGYADLFKLIVAGVGKPNLSEAFSRLRVITFNYDRTLEQFLHKALIQHSRITVAEASDVLSNSQIIHAYGQLMGPDRSPVQPKDLFLAEPANWAALEAMASGIRTFSETCADDDRSLMSELMRTSSAVIFLGCAFHQQNMKLLRPERFAGGVYATAYSPPPEDPLKHAQPAFETYSKGAADLLRSHVFSWSAGLSPVPFIAAPMTCRQLIARHGGSWIS